MDANPAPTERVLVHADVRVDAPNTTEVGDREMVPDLDVRCSLPGVSHSA